MVVAAVAITITETEVVFSVFHMLVTIQKEQHSECIIGATSVEDYPARVIMDTDCTGPFMLASYLSKAVWILHCDDPMALHQLNIPVGSAGNIIP
ncbi:hypothetical protein FH972_003956 [Carpinus fangiana]|uniref:Uncharacterized protein n=1 Tax=Carpinus fangiana TaxID=176857 RepID=A0A5N6QLJ3_9ROSI|nr:hypothetical protein FH972_003956 [Carpinus fangiana]